MIIDISLSFILSLIFSLILIRIFIPILRKVKLGQKILEIGPSWHKCKEGTPVMGGLFFMTATILTLVIMFVTKKLTGTGLFFAINLAMMLLNASVGFFDDYVKLIKKRNKGLNVKQKFIPQMIISALYLAALVKYGYINSTVILPFSGKPLDLGIGFYVIFILGIVYILNGANFTDGIDGLAGSVGIIIAVLFLAVGFKNQSSELYIFQSALIGALCGFLFFNFHPAKIFMGETGSLFLGAVFVTACVRIGAFALIAVIGIVYIVESLSVILQVVSYKTRKKRIFKMAPIHHHFEMLGWSEVKIVAVFSFITVIFCGLAYLLYVKNFISNGILINF